MLGTVIFEVKFNAVEDGIQIVFVGVYVKLPLGLAPTVIGYFVLSVQLFTVVNL